MIRYLSDDEKGRSEALYRAAFPEDKDEFVNYYYSYVTRDNKILVVEQDNEICSMLHLNPYRLSVNETIADAYYYVAVATKENCRHQGMMRSLLYQSLNDIYKEGHPFTYLMPANRAIYEPFDFRIVYQQKKVALPLDPEAANEKMAELFDVYTLRDFWYVEKMLEEERVCAGDPPFEIVPYIMTRITHVEKMLSLLRSERPMKIILNVQDRIISENNGLFLWDISCSGSICISVDRQNTLYQSALNADGKEENAHSELLDQLFRMKNENQLQMNDSESDCNHGYKEVFVNIAELTEFVFGKRNIEGLEDIHVLSKICINEAV